MALSVVPGLPGFLEAVNARDREALLRCRAAIEVIIVQKDKG
jgi:hypothetical protein